MLISCSSDLQEIYPGLKVAAWRAEVISHTVMDLPVLADVAAQETAASFAAQRMSAFFRLAGGRGRSPVEFQIEKVKAREMGYSRHNGLVDFLLYSEVKTGYIVGLHDLSQAAIPGLMFALGREATDRSFLHITKSHVEVKDTEPVILSGGRIIASLTRGPDRDTRVTKRTTSVHGLMFGAPADPVNEFSKASEWVSTEGETRGIWKVTRREQSPTVVY